MLFVTSLTLAAMEVCKFNMYYTSVLTTGSDEIDISTGEYHGNHGNHGNHCNHVNHCNHTL